MKVNLITYTPNAEQLVAAAAKLCYSKSEIKDLMDNLTADKVESFLKRLTDMGHQSPFEHISFTFGVEDVSRSLLAQLTRHRMASYSVQSQRYVHDSFGYVTPPEIANYEYLNSFYQDILDNVYIAYEHLAKHLQDRYVSEGMKEKDAEKKAIEDARYVLPNACCTRLMVTMNARELMHFFNHRCCNRAQWEIREMADEMLKQVKEVAPYIFSKAGAPCTYGVCPEGVMSCGNPRKDLR